MADALPYGLTVKPGHFTSDERTCFPIVANVDPSGAADRSGVIQVGDRLISVNRQQTSQLTIDEITRIIDESEPRLLLELQFDVAESVVPSSGTFSVKLPKHDGGLGISITCKFEPLPRIRHQIYYDHINRVYRLQRIKTEDAEMP